MDEKTLKTPVGAIHARSRIMCVCVIDIHGINERICMSREGFCSGVGRVYLQASATNPFYLDGPQPFSRNNRAGYEFTLERFRRRRRKIISRQTKVDRD